MTQQIQAITLILAAVCNLIMGITMTTRGWKNPVYKYFSLMAFFNVLWALGLLIFNVSNTQEIVRFSGSFIYLVALMVALNLFYFAWCFPFKIFNFDKAWQNILTFIVSLYSLYFVFFYKQFIPVVNIIGQNDCVFSFIPYMIFTIILFVLMLAAIGVLFIKYFRAEKIFKKPIFLILVSTIIGVIAGSWFNLLAMYVSDFNNYHLGPLFTLVINFMAFYLIFSKRDKKIEY